MLSAAATSSYQVPIFPPKSQNILSKTRIFPGTHLYKLRRMASLSGFGVRSQMALCGSSYGSESGVFTLKDLGKQTNLLAVAGGGSDRDAPKPLDIVSNEIILSSLQNSGKVAVMASEENDAPIWISDDVVAAGYILYSSATILCTTFGSGTQAFTLDRTAGDFILRHPSLKIPPRGQIYSVNDARYYDWPEGLRQYIDTIRQGKGRYPKKYSARYICSLVADLHLRLVYEANPLSFIVEQAGGRGSDGKNRILSLQPVKLHQRLPLFLGSLEDMEELESYGDVQQKVTML
ncbi:hypothetical protein L6164_036402 [Bauhinia variegata]|uniref:Uncharacterized protein n=1 Tax=Bauhinia variegata TaxID=167791 RepID=A0ACB9KH02_BAUVA|nr:hypothetical protein L6164_036402 [Bauhinia variegata]